MGGIVGHGGKRAEAFAATVGSTQITLTSTVPVYTCTDQISTAFAFDDTGVLKVTIDQIDSSAAFKTLVKTYGYNRTGGAMEVLTMEDGESQSQAPSALTLVWLIRGAIITGGTDDGKRDSYAGYFTIDKTSGSRTQAGNTIGKPSLNLTAQPITLPLVIPASVLTSYQTTPATVTLSSTTQKYGDSITA